MLQAYSTITVFLNRKMALFRDLKSYGTCTVNATLQ